MCFVHTREDLFFKKKVPYVFKSGIYNAWYMHVKHAQKKKMSFYFRNRSLNNIYDSQLHTHKPQKKIQENFGKMLHRVFHIMILKTGKKPKAEENNGTFHDLPFTSKEDDTQTGYYKFSCTKGLYQVCCLHLQPQKHSSTRFSYQRLLAILQPSKATFKIN